MKKQLWKRNDGKMNVVIRNAGWSNAEEYLKASTKNGSVPWFDNLGLRCIRLVQVDPIVMKVRDEKTPSKRNETMKPRTITELSYETAEMLKATINEANRCKSMDLCKEILNRCDLVSHHDQLMRDTLRSWIRKIQDKFQNTSKE